MSRYEEMVKTAKEARSGWELRDQAARRFIAQVLERFRDYCEIPPDRIKFLPWDEQKKIYEGDVDEVAPFHRVVNFDEEENAWHIGICLLLSAPKSRPRYTVTFNLHVEENNSRYMARLGSINTQPLDLNDQKQSEAFFDSAVKMLKASFDDPKKKGKGLGFHIEPGQPGLNISDEVLNKARGQGKD